MPYLYIKQVMELLWHMVVQFALAIIASEFEISDAILNDCSGWVCFSLPIAHSCNGNVVYVSACSQSIFKAIWRYYFFFLTAFLRSDPGRNAGIRTALYS